MQVDYTGFSTINTQRFGQKFVGKVANPNDMVLWQKAAARRQRVRAQPAPAALPCRPPLLLRSTAVSSGWRCPPPWQHSACACLPTSWVWTLDTLQEAAAAGAAAPALVRPEALDESRIEDLIGQHLQHNLEILPEEVCVRDVGVGA